MGIVHHLFACHHLVGDISPTKCSRRTTTMMDRCPHTDRLRLRYDVLALPGNQKYVCWAWFLLWGSDREKQKQLGKFKKSQPLGMSEDAFQSAPQGLVRSSEEGWWSPADQFFVLGFSGQVWVLKSIWKMFLQTLSHWCKTWKQKLEGTKIIFNIMPEALLSMGVTFRMWIRMSWTLVVCYGSVLPLFLGPDLFILYLFVSTSAFAQDFATKGTPMGWSCTLAMSKEETSELWRLLPSGDLRGQTSLGEWVLGCFGHPCLESSPQNKPARIPPSVSIKQQPCAVWVYSGSSFTSPKSNKFPASIFTIWRGTYFRWMGSKSKIFSQLQCFDLAFLVLPAFRLLKFERPQPQMQAREFRSQWLSYTKWLSQKPALIHGQSWLLIIKKHAVETCIYSAWVLEIPSDQRCKDHLYCFFQPHTLSSKPQPANPIFQPFQLQHPSGFKHSPRHAHMHMHRYSAVALRVPPKEFLCLVFSLKIPTPTYSFKLCGLSDTDTYVWHYQVFGLQLTTCGATNSPRPTGWSCHWFPAFFPCAMDAMDGDGGGRISAPGRKKWQMHYPWGLILPKSVGDVGSVHIFIPPILCVACR